MPRIRSVLSSSVPSSGPSGRARWPVPWGATRRPRSRARPIAAATSSADSANATASGRWSTASGSLIGALGGFPQRRQLAHPAEPAERARLDLAHALRGDPELAPDLAQRRRLAAGDAVAQLDDLALAVGQLVQRR